MKRYIALALLCLSLVFSGCASDKKNSHEMLLGVLWTQTSVEAKMAVAQAFYLAELNLEKALADPNWTAALEQKNDFQELPPAIVIDIDETVLDNSPFAARMVLSGKEYDPTLWETWVNESSAAAMPGAQAFIQQAKKKGVAVLYVTNRVLKAPTVENIKSVLDPDVVPADVLCRKEQPGWGSDKTSRRAFIAKRYRILLLLGDDYNDFAFVGKVDPAARIRTAKAHQQYWGGKWILISNPLHGSWKTALYNDSRSLADEDKLKVQHRYLDVQGIAQ